MDVTVYFPMAKITGSGNVNQCDATLFPYFHLYCSQPLPNSGFKLLWKTLETALASYDIEGYW